MKALLLLAAIHVLIIYQAEKKRLDRINRMEEGIATQKQDQDKEPGISSYNNSLSANSVIYEYITPLAVTPLFTKMNK